MRWLELSVETDAEAVEAVSEILGRVSAGSAVRPTRLILNPEDVLDARQDLGAPFVVTAHIPDERDAPASVEATERALWHLQAFGLGRIGRLDVRSVDDEGWADAWREHYVAQRIGRVVIVPSWADERLRDGELVVRMDPGMAFGTGLHPTTRGCLEMLQEIGPMPAAVMDLGCGSGILGLAALRLGAEHVTALDTDADAVRASAENAQRNGLGDRFDVRRGTLGDEPRGTFALILANLVAAILMELAPRLAAHLAPGGWLIAGGIVSARGDEVTAALLAAGLELQARRDDGEWVTLRLERLAAPR